MPNHYNCSLVMPFSRIASCLLLTLALATQVFNQVSAATLEHRYSFTTDANDTIGGAHGTLLGGATISDGAVVLNGSGAYVDLPNGIISTYSSITFEIWVTDHGSDWWARIFDFGFSDVGEGSSGTGTNYIFLTPQSGGWTLRGALVVNSLGGEQSVEWSETRLPTGSQKHVVLTIDAASQTGRLYVDGELVSENTSMTFNPTQLGYTVNNWIGRSQWNDPYFFGSITEFRIYDGALTAAEVQQNYNFGQEVISGPVTFLTQPQSQTVEEATPVTLGTTFKGTPPVGLQWRRNGVAIAGATNATYIINSAALTNNNDAYSVVLTNRRHPHRAGRHKPARVGIRRQFVSQ